jgi:hypothetical protein
MISCLDIDVQAQLWYNVPVWTNGWAGLFMPSTQLYTIAGKGPASRGTGNRPPIRPDNDGPASWPFVLSAEDEMTTETKKAYMKKWDAEHPEKRKEYNRQWYLRHADELRTRYARKAEEQAEDKLSLKYDMTASYSEMLIAQGGVCAVCGKPPDRYRLCVDHDHETGKVRALLCHSCNRALGYAGDDPRRLRALAEYLEGKS